MSTGLQRGRGAAPVTALAAVTAQGSLPRYAVGEIWNVESAKEAGRIRSRLRIFGRQSVLLQSEDDGRTWTVVNR